jgi:hypothetical protein
MGLLLISDTGSGIDLIPYRIAKVVNLANEIEAIKDKILK